MGTGHPVADDVTDDDVHLAGGPQERVVEVAADVVGVEDRPVLALQPAVGVLWEARRDQAALQVVHHRGVALAGRHRVGHEGRELLEDVDGPRVPGMSLVVDDAEAAEDPAVRIADRYAAVGLDTDVQPCGMVHERRVRPEVVDDDRLLRRDDVLADRVR